MWGLLFHLQQWYRWKNFCFFNLAQAPLPHNNIMLSMGQPICRPTHKQHLRVSQVKTTRDSRKSAFFFTVLVWERKITVAIFCWLRAKNKEREKLEREKLQGLDWRVIRNPIETKFYPRDHLVRFYSSIGSDFGFHLRLVTPFKTYFFNTCSFWGWFCSRLAWLVLVILLSFEYFG